MKVINHFDEVERKKQPPSSIANNKTRKFVILEFCVKFLGWSDCCKTYWTFTWIQTAHRKSWRKGLIKTLIIFVANPQIKSINKGSMGNPVFLQFALLE